MIDFANEMRPRLDAVWSHAVPDGCEGMQGAYRYVPRCIDVEEGEWKVYDRKQQRFLYPYEIVAVSLEDLHHEKHYDA